MNVLSKLVVTFVVFGSQATLASVEDWGIETKTRHIEQSYIQDMKQGTSVANYPNSLKLRENRKMGIGAGVGGALGLAGLNFELNIEDADGALAGFGGGDGYNSFQLAWKHMFMGDYLAPYFTAGYSRWYNSSNSENFEGASGVLGRVLTQKEKMEGVFGKDFLNASFGIQYNQLSGILSGVSVYGEVAGMYEVHQGMLLPNGSVGALYYF